MISKLIKARDLKEGDFLSFMGFIKSIQTVIPQPLTSYMTTRGMVIITYDNLYHRDQTHTYGYSDYTNIDISLKEILSNL